MTTRPAHARQLDAAQLRALLTLSRELFQTDEASSSLRLVGRTVIEMIGCDAALLLVRGEGPEKRRGVRGHRWPQARQRRNRP